MIIISKLAVILNGIAFIYCMIQYFKCEKGLENRFLLWAIIFKLCEIYAYLHVEL